MSYYIIIRGSLGVGKSTVAKKLAKQLNAEYISIDELLKNQKLDVIEGECIPLKNFIKVIDTVLPEVKKHLKNKIVVFDGNFYHKEQIDYLVRHLDTPNYAFTLTAPIHVCLERDTAREKTLGEEAAKAVHNLVMRVDYGTQIKTEGKTADDVVKEILFNLPK